MNRVKHPVRDRGEWIMRLLYVPDANGRQNAPLFGKTRLQKAAFLLARKLSEEFEVETGFDFRPDKYGPFDPGIYDAVTLLENQDFLAVDDPHEHGKKYDLVRYQLTDKGIREAESLFNELPEGQQELVRWVKNKHAMKRLGRLLTYVYNEYPEMTVESELV
jgi:uncharacterized protein YwgA